MARTLVKKKIQKAIRDAVSAGDPQDDDVLAAGHMRLYGYYKPSLEAGLYGIEAKQTINATGNDTLQVWNYRGPKANPLPAVERQLFSVAAPQFNLDSKLINTFYPPSGHQDEGRILPHIVFNDPHVPWLRRCGVTFPDPLDPDVNSPDPKLGRNMVPWMALVVFETDELVVQPSDAASIGLTSIASYVPGKLPANGSFDMAIGEYLSKITKNRIYYEAGYTEAAAQSDWDNLKASTDSTSIIFPTKARIQEIFGSGDLNILQGHKFLSHVRNVNTVGFPDAGVQEDGLYSVVISSVTGRVDNTAPVTQVVHLVSLEHYDSTITDKSSPFGLLSATDRVGLVSLFSWVYTSIPEAVNFVQVIQNLAAQMQPIKPPQSVLQSLQDSISNQPTVALKTAAQIIHDRLSSSYTLCRWRTSTGEETVAFNRGPLVSAPTPDVPAKSASTWPSLSMSGKDYQIFDDDVGVMDVTYSSAWSLGRLVAISDSPFNAALLRFRSLVWQQSASNTRLLVNNILPTKTVLSKISASIQDAHLIQPHNFTGPVSRLNPPSTDSVAPPLSHADVAPFFAKALQQAVNANASTDTGEEVYNDFQLASAANSDWELIHNWISNCLYLAKIPAHYLFPEPSQIQGQPDPEAPPSIPNLPPEALRFFFIDHAWLDCFLDGALSCGNHLEPQFDSTRLRIKEVYNYYLRSTIHPLEGQTPPIPRSGFILRSSAVKAIPDLKVTVTARTWNGSAWIKDLNRDPVVQITKMDDFTILCLLDCLPQEMYQVTIAQPPHQQRFAMGASLKPDTNGKIVPELEVRMLYTNLDAATKAAGDTGMWPVATVQPPLTDQGTYYQSETRVIDPTSIANSVNKVLLASSNLSTPVSYDDAVADSCVLGLELNDPSYQLSIDAPAPSGKGPLTPWVRQLWTGSVQSNSKLLTKSPAFKAKVSVKISQPPAITAKQMKEMPPAPSVPRLNSTKIIPKPVSKTEVSLLSTPSIKVTTTINGPQFTVVLHPDYRPPPPTPYQAASGGNIYAPMDFLPTDTINLYDIVLAIRRIKPSTSPGYKLVEIDVELPISDGTDAPDGSGNIREPLIPAGGYNGGGVRMTSNHRFVPTLYTAIDRSKKTVLGIKLIPRSGEPSATIALTNDGRSSDASVRLAECPVAPIVDKSKSVPVAQVGSDGKGTGTSARQPRGICKIVLKEVYLLDNGTTTTITTDGNTVLAGPGVPLWVLKRAGGDVDLNGNAV